MDPWNASTLTMPTGDFVTTTTSLSEKHTTSVSEDSADERNVYTDSVLSMTESPSVILIPEGAFQQDFSASRQVRIVGCLADGIYQVEWMKTPSGNGSDGCSEKTVDA